jgi:hypothetical protein
MEGEILTQAEDLVDDECLSMSSERDWLVFVCA